MKQRTKKEFKALIKIEEPVVFLYKGEDGVFRQYRQNTKDIRHKV